MRWRVGKNVTNEKNVKKLAKWRVNISLCRQSNKKKCGRRWGKTAASYKRMPLFGDILPFIWVVECGGMVFLSSDTHFLRDFRVRFFSETNISNGNHLFPLVYHIVIILLHLLSLRLLGKYYCRYSNRTRMLCSFNENAAMRLKQMLPMETEKTIPII